MLKNGCGFEIMYDNDFWMFPLIVAIIVFFAVFVSSFVHSLNREPDTYIPPCDFNHRGHWEVSVSNANNQREVEPIVNKYIALGWHDIHAEIHNEGVQDRILADC